jgi:hypothetical protein
MFAPTVVPVARWKLQHELGAGHGLLCLQKNETACLASRMQSSLITIANESIPQALQACYTPALQHNENLEASSDS